MALTLIVADTLQSLRAELVATRERYGRSSGYTQMAFERLFRFSCQIGEPLDQLQKHSRNEVERFFAQTVPGPDGHVYWEGAREFTRNDGKQRRPIRWWWEHSKAPLDLHDDVVLTCGEKTCINPEHAIAGRHLVRGGNRLYTDDQLLGLLQTTAMRLGRTPTTGDWDALEIKPGHTLLSHRFGNWASAVRSAGLKPVKSRKATRSECMKTIRTAAHLLGRWPSQYDLQQNEYVRQHLKALGLPVAVTTIKLRCGGWPKDPKSANKP